MNNDELKPCAKCGSSNVGYYHWNGAFNEWFAVECRDCKNRSEYNSHVFNDKAYAASVWNKRPTEDSKDAEIRRLKDKLNAIYDAFKDEPCPYNTPCHLCEDAQRCAVISDAREV